MLISPTRSKVSPENGKSSGLKFVAAANPMVVIAPMSSAHWSFLGLSLLRDAIRTLYWAAGAGKKCYDTSFVAFKMQTPPPMETIRGVC